MAYLSINGFRCHYEIRRQTKDGPWVIFLNGIMSALESWTGQAPIAARLGFNVLQFEYRGQWRSEVTPGPYAMQTHVDDLHALLNELGIDKAHFVGTSYGGMTAMKFACQYPEIVQSMLLITTTALIRPLPQRILATWRRLAEQNDIENLLLTALPDLYSEECLHSRPNLAGDRLASFRQLLGELPDFCTGQAILNAAQFPDLGDGSLLDAIASVRCPTLVLAAAEDRLYPPSDSAAITRRIPGAEMLVVHGAGHALVAERPQIVNTILAGHLQDQLPS